jgi:hypothetical protein
VTAQPLKYYLNMTKFAVVTSMDHAYYEKCGRACIESFNAYWPNSIPLYVYDEGIQDRPKLKTVHYQPWTDLGKDYEEFIAGSWTSRTITFAKKAFSIMAGARDIDCDRLIWLDADVITLQGINQHLLDLISPLEVLSTHYGVLHPWPSDTDQTRFSFSCETGFFILNRRHAMFETMMNRYQNWYVTGKGNELRRFYDGEVYGAVIKEMENEGAKVMELNPEQRHRTPIPRSVMAPYIMHYKAGAKEPFNSEMLLQNHGISSSLS